MFLSPHYTRDHINLDGDVSIDNRITILEDRIRGYYTTPARLLANIYENSILLVLLAVVSCIELLEVFHKGESSNNRAGRFFKDGFVRVFNPKPGKSVPKDQYEADLGEILEAFYARVRCGLAHAGTTRSKVVINKRLQVPAIVEFSREPRSIISISINPTLSLLALDFFLSDYCVKLRDPTNVELRENFQKGWEILREEEANGL